MEKCDALEVEDSGDILFEELGGERQWKSVTLWRLKIADILKKSGCHPD